MNRPTLRRTLAAATALATTFAAVAPPAQATIAAPVYAPIQVALAVPPKVADTCAPLRQPFQRAKDYVRNETIKGVAVGIVGGALLGLLGGGGKNRAGNVITGAIGGAFVGGLASYLQAKQQQAHTQAELQAAIAGDADNDMRIYSSLARDLALLGDCRRAQFYQLRQQVEARTVTPDEARAQLATIQQAVTADDTLVSAAANVQTQRVGRYVQAYGIASGLSEAQVQAAGDTGATMQEAEVAAYVPAVYVARADASGALQSETQQAAFVTPAQPAASPAVVRYVQGKRGQHLMAEPGVGSAILIDVPAGEAVEVLESASSPAWSQARWNGKTGYLSTASLAAEGPDSPPGAGAPKAKKRAKRVVQPTIIAARAVPVPPVAPPPAHKVLTGPRKVEVAAVRAPGDNTPAHHLAAAVGSVRAVKVVLAQNKAATASEEADTLRSIQRMAATNS